MNQFRLSKVRKIPAPLGFDIDGYLVREEKSWPKVEKAEEELLCHCSLDDDHNNVSIQRPFSNDSSLSSLASFSTCCQHRQMLDKQHIYYEPYRSSRSESHIATREKFRKFKWIDDHIDSSQDRFPRSKSYQNERNSKDAFVSRFRDDLRNERIVYRMKRRKTRKKRIDNNDDDDDKKFNLVDEDDDDDDDDESSQEFYYFYDGDNNEKRSDNKYKNFNYYSKR